MTFTLESRSRRDPMRHLARPHRHGRGHAHGPVVTGPGVWRLCAMGLGVACSFSSPAAWPSIDLEIEQVTSGDKHHFFGYIGKTLKSGRGMGGKAG